MLVAIFPRVNGGHLGFSSFQLYLYIARRFTATFRDNIESDSKPQCKSINMLLFLLKIDIFSSLFGRHLDLFVFYWKIHSCIRFVVLENI